MGVYDRSQAQELDLESVNSSRGYFVVLECLGCQIVHTQLVISI